MKSIKSSLGKNNFQGLWLFLRENGKNHKIIGALWPSSKELARRMAEQVLQNSGLVIELGGGTGIVSTALLERGIPPDQLVIIELSQPLFRFLKNKFPDITVIQGDAAQLSSLLTKNRQIQSIVSSLPLRYIPKKIVESIGEELCLMLDDGGLFIQFTYALMKPPMELSPMLHWERSFYVWRNMPPARIDLYRCRKP